MDTTMNETTSTMQEEEDNYDEPIWKTKRSRSFVKPASYSRKNANKFLDKDLGERNRELFRDLFNQDPNETVCDENEFEKELFADLKVPENPQVKPTKKRATKKKQKDGENPEFLSGQYQRNLENQRTKLRDLFEKSSVYQNLQLLKDTPLNIQTIDHKGEVVKRIQYFYDYEENKHDFVEVKNNDDEEEDNRMETSASSVKRKNDEDEERPAPKRKRATTKSTAASAKQQQRDDESELGTPKSSRKRKMHFDDLNDHSISSFRGSAIKSTSTPTLKRHLAKIDEQEETADEEQISKFDSNAVDSESEEEEFWVDLPAPAKKTASKAPAKSKAKSSSKTSAASKTKTSKANTSKANSSTASTSKANTSSKASKETTNTESTRPRRSARSKK